MGKKLLGREASKAKRWTTPVEKGMQPQSCQGPLAEDSLMAVPKKFFILAALRNNTSDHEVVRNGIASTSVWAWKGIAALGVATEATLNAQMLKHWGICSPILYEEYTPVSQSLLYSFHQSAN